MNRYIKQAVLLLLPAVVMAACATSSNGSDNNGAEFTTSNNESELGEPVSFTVIESGELDGDGLRGAKIAEFYLDQAAYDSAVNTYSLRVSDAAIDFSSTQVVLVSIAGTGHRFAAKSLRDTGDYLELNLRLGIAGDNCVVIQVLARPYQLLKIDSRKEVQIKQTKVVENCS